jgi:cytochrome P450
VVGDDFTLRGQELRRGQRVLIMLGAANRDPDQFPEPDQLDIQRQPNRHIAFGYGIHFCLGAPLARIEGSIALRTVLQRMPDIHLTGEALEWRKNLSNRNPLALPVAF